MNHLCGLDSILKRGSSMKFDAIDFILSTFLVMIPLSVLGIWKLIEIILWFIERF